MALNLSKVKTTSSGPKAEPLEPGTYPARVVQIVDLGLQTQRAFKGTTKPPAHEMRLVYELSDEFMPDEEGNDDEGKPRWIAEDFSVNNLNKDLATSTKRYKALDPDIAFGGDFTKLIGAPCNVTIVQNPGKGANVGKVYNNVAGISAMRTKDADRLPALVNDSVIFDLDEPDLEAFDNFPEFLQDKIKGNLEFNGSVLDKALNGAGSKPSAPKASTEEETDEDEKW